MGGQGIRQTKKIGHLLEGKMVIWKIEGGVNREKWLGRQK